MSAKYDKRIFARNLQKYMDENNKSRREMSEILGISYYTFSDWVNAKKFPRIDKIEAIADYFGIEKSDLIEENVQKEITQKIDAATDILIRMERDKNFSEVVQLLNKLDEEKLNVVRMMLNSFS